MMNKNKGQMGICLEGVDKTTIMEEEQKKVIRLYKKM